MGRAHANDVHGENFVDASGLERGEEGKLHILPPPLMCSTNKIIVAKISVNYLTFSKGCDFLRKIIVAIMYYLDRNVCYRAIQFIVL